jgi:hypothetical protein
VLPVESFSKIQTLIVLASLCTSLPQGANHFCGPSDLLSTTTTCFSKLITCMVWCLYCGQNLDQIATHFHPSASSVCPTYMFPEPQNCLPQSGHEQYHDSQTIAYVISHMNTEFFMGGLSALDIPRFTCPQIIPHKLAFVETCTFVHAVHGPSLLLFL